jgi:hypothetical protein
MHQLETAFGLTDCLHGKRPDTGRFAATELHGQTEPFVGQREVLQRGQIQVRAECPEAAMVVAEVAIVRSGRESGEIEFDA